MTHEISFFGVIIDRDGVRMDETKVHALKSARSPKNASELKSFLGLATFCSRFIPNFSTLTGPLRQLLKNNVSFNWQTTHEKAFIEMKSALSADTYLSYFDPRATCKLVTDASDYGLGAVLLQTKGAVNRPIAFASKSLTELEAKYTTTEKECLALVFAVQKFHNYLFGKEFEAFVDHKPLESLNNCNKRANARIERWIMTLQNYRFKIIHKPGSENIADCLSRLSATERDDSATEIDHHINFVTSNSIPCTMSLEQVRIESRNDTELEALRNSLATNDWTSEDVKMYKNVRQEIAENDGILLRQNQIILPNSLRTCAINISHRGHLGITKTKGLLRSKVYWPNMSKDVETNACQAVTNSEKPEPLKPSPLPTAPWCEISVDFHGPLPSGENLLVILDEYSRFPIVHVMKSTTADCVINKLEPTFALFGYPDKCKTDNGPPFDSTKIKEYMKQNSIHHHKITPLHPQSNAKCERFMKVIGKTLKTATIEGRN